MLGVWGILFMMGCAPTDLVAPVTVVATRTPGVSFVIVRPKSTVGHHTASRLQPGDNSKVNNASWYMLMCDARPVDGMHCSIPTEAALARYSYTPATGVAAAPIDQGVGTLSDFSTHLSRDKDDAEPVAPAPAPATVPTVAPPAAPPVTPAAAGKTVKP